MRAWADETVQARFQKKGEARLVMRKKACALLLALCLIPAAAEDADTLNNILLPCLDSIRWS